MSLAQQLHVSNVRLEIPWFLVEPSKGGYDWSRADYIFSSAAAHGIVIQPILVYTPAWDGGYNAFPVAADFQAFVTTFMGRYGSRINAVEMWNEPDGGQSLAANNPAQYVQTILIFVQQVVHFPELLVGGRKLGGLRSRLRIRMHLA
jgi:GH35 family endo-1,4-beta-xylanase